MIERSWPNIGPISVTATGTSKGRLTIASTRGIKVKMSVILADPSFEDTIYEVKRVNSANEIELGPPGNIKDRSDLSQWTTTSNLSAKSQVRSNIPLNELDRAVYEEEPTVAVRVVNVDRLGNIVDVDNPLPVQLSDGSINIGNLNANVEVQLSAADNYPNPGDVHDSVRIGSPSGNEVEVNSDGSINVNVTSASAGPGLDYQYNEITAVAQGVETPLISKTVSNPDGYRISKIDVSGENLAFYQLKVDGTVIASKRTWWTEFNGTFTFENFANGLLIPQSSTVEVTVLHNRPALANFEATIYGL